MQTIASFWELFAALAFVLILVLTVAACRGWYGRQRRRLEHRFGRLQVDRDALAQQVKRAREQVTQLQKELASSRLAVPAAGPGKSAPGAVEPKAAPQPPLKLRPDFAAGLLFEAPQLPAHGFADTQPFADDAVPGLARKGP